MPTLFDTYRYTANNGIGDTQVFPVVRTVRKRWERVPGQRAYREKVATPLLFRGADYAYFRAIYDAGECANVTLTIERKCEGEWDVWHVGRVPINDGEYNESFCQVTFEIQPDDVYQCAADSFAVKKNWLEFGTATTLKTGVTGATIETVTCDTAENIPLDLDLHFSRACWGDTLTSSTDPEPTLAWRPISHYQYYVPFGSDWTVISKTTWAREKITSGTQPPGDGWINLSGTTWVRPVSVSFPKKTLEPTSAGVSWEAQIINKAPISNGRLLPELIEAVVADLDCAIDEVVSNFFGINADATNPTNDAYDNATDNLQNVFFFQKSDIVRASASNDASRFEATLDEFLKDISEALQVFWALENDGGTIRLRIEHYTYFDGQNGLDLTAGDAKYIRGLNSFKSKAEVPAFEEFAYQESYRPKFMTQRIDYGANCVSAQSISRASRRLCCDVGGLLENPDAGLDGFVLAAAHDIGGGEYLLNTLGGEANGAFAWTNVLPELWVDGRFDASATATVDGYTVGAIRKGRQQGPIVLPLCCADEFAPGDLVNTQIGWGEVESAEFDAETATLTLNLLQ
jgi:hypothetical protein